MNSKLKAWVVDTAERTGTAYGAAFLGLWFAPVAAAIANGGDSVGALRGIVHTSVAVKAAVAAAPAAVVVIKSAFAAFRGGTVSPASFAPAQQPGQAEQDAPPDIVDDGTPVEAAAVPATSVAADRTVVLPERKVQGRRLGRHVHHDERSRAYPFTPRHTAPLKSVRHRRHVPPFDQGDVGSCTGNACAGALSTAPFTHRFTEKRAVAIYSAATKLDNVPGAYPPDDTGSDGLSVAKVAQRNGWITGYQHCFSIDDVLAALQVGPVLLGVSWRAGFDNPLADGRMSYTGAVRGGHEIVADEIDVENQRVWITNSWGSGWGVKGRAYWTFGDLAKVLADQGDATVLIR